MPFRDDADPFPDDPPPRLTYGDWVAILAFGLSLALFAIVLFFGLRCVWHRIGAAIAMLMS